MATEYAECEVFVLVDRDGDYVATHDRDTLAEDYEEAVQALSECGGYRVVCLKVKVPLPAEVELIGEAPAQGAAELAAVAPAGWAKVEAGQPE